MDEPNIIEAAQRLMREQAMKQCESYPLLDRRAVESMIRSAIEAFARTQTEKEAHRQKARSEMFQRFQEIIAVPDCEEITVCDAPPQHEYRMRPATEADLEAHSRLTLPPQAVELVVFQAETPPEPAPRTELPLTLLGFDPEQGRHWILEPLQSPQEADATGAQA